MKIEKYLGRNGKPVDNKRKVSAKDGTTAVIELRGKNWRTRFAANGKHHQLNLRTVDEKQAAATALDKVRAASRDQWDFVHAGQAKKGVITIGQCIEIHIGQLAPNCANKHLSNGGNRLRGLISQALGIPGRLKKDSEGIHSWPEVDRLPATILDSHLIDKFYAHRLKGLDKGEARESRIRGANSHIQDARSVFTKASLADGRYPGLPDISSFVNKQKLKEMKKSFKYEAVDNEIQRLLAHLPELKESNPASYLAFQLTAVLGLRRGEAAQARKSWITSHKGKKVLYVQATPTWVPKGRQERKIPLPEEVHSEILLLSDDSEFIIPALSANYRYEKVFNVLSAWFLKICKDWPDTKKAHVLRKWFGAEVSTQTGNLFAAQILLGHASHTTTMNSYADLLNVPEYEINLTAEQPAEQAKAVG